MKHPGATHGSPRLDYCSIPWDQILRWSDDGVGLTHLDIVAMAVVTLAFTTIRRVGSFLPPNAKESDEFSWIIPRYIRRSKRGTTLLVWIPRVKTDPEGRGTVLTVKETGDAGCPIGHLCKLLKRRTNNGPLFCYKRFIPTQKWLLAWIRARMSQLGKNPL